MNRVLVLGNATLDVIQRVDRLPAPGETVLASSTVRCAGGKGLNQAVAAARTGAATLLVAPIGKDADAEFIAGSLKDEAELNLNWLACDAPTDLSSIWVTSGGENVIVSSAGCAHSMTPDQARQLCGALAPDDVLLMQGNLSQEVTRAAAQAAQARGAIRILNTAPIAWDMREVLGLFDIVIANEGEAAQLTAGTPSTGARTLIITLGARGALIVEGGIETAIGAPRVTAVDTSGAGDVFVGTLAGLKASGARIVDAVGAAIGAASLSVTRPNTTPSFPSRAEVAAIAAAPGPARRRSVEGIGVRSFATRAAMGQAAARDIAAAIRARLTVADGVRMIFAAAPSQSDMIAALIAQPDVDWRRVTAFHMDEYIGLPSGAPQRFAVWLQECLFDRLPFRAVHPILPDPAPQAAAEHYAALLDAAPIDIVCLGIGVNGHIAFNDPPVADFADPKDVKIVELDAVCRQQQVDDKCFPDLAAVPRQALTLTVPRLLRADKLFCVVPGAQKRDAIRATLHGPISTACPASVLRRQADCTLYLDVESDPDA